MKISIITTCYNRVGTLRDAIEIVLSQDYPHIEYIVVDGASTDGSLEVIAAYRDRIAVVISEPDNGMYEALNKGIRAATGDVIGVVHSDDTLYDRHVISEIAETFRNTNADFVYSNGLFVKHDQPDKPVRDWISGSYSKRKVKFGWLPLHPTCYIRRETMLRTGLYDESYRIAADSDLLVRYLYKANLRVAYLPQYIIRMRMGGMSTDSRKRKQMWDEDVRMYRSHGFWAVPTKILKMLWKVPQFVKAKFQH